MKQTLTTLMILIITSISINGQANNVEDTKTTVIEAAFTKKYPGIQVEKWKHSKELSIAKFVVDQKKHKAIFDLQGNWIQTEVSIKWGELPIHIVNSYFANIANWENWTSVKEVQSPDYNILYVVEGDNEEEESDHLYEFKLYFTNNGTLIKRESNE